MKFWIIVGIFLLILFCLDDGDPKIDNSPVPVKMPPLPPRLRTVDPNDPRSEFPIAVPFNMNKASHGAWLQLCFPAQRGWYYSVWQTMDLASWFQPKEIPDAMPVPNPRTVVFSVPLERVGNAFYQIRGRSP